jgi:hypothetical protein
MLIDEKILVKINKKNIKHYKKVGFDVKLKDIITIDSKFLIRGSNTKVKVKCDKCETEKILKYQSYMNNFEKGNIYLCNKCKIDKICKTNLEKYGVKIFNNRNKCKITNIKKYGCENVSGSEIIKNKKKETNLKNWGVENVFQSDIIKEQIKNTFIEKYGVEHPLQNEDLLEKSKKTCFKNNGVEYPMQSEKVIKTMIENNLKKFGKKHYTQTDEYKNDVKISNLEKYGSKWYMGSSDFREKSKKYYMDNFGIEYNMQNEDIYMKAQISGHKSKIHKETNLFYRGTYEKDFLDFCVSNSIKIEKGKRFSYFFDGKKRYYFSDFYLPHKNLVIEIKSSYYYKKYYNMNESKKHSTLKEGYNFLFVIDKNYDQIKEIIPQKEVNHHPKESNRV